MRLTIHHFTEVESTNTTAKEYLESGQGEEGVVIVADKQVGGYGRQNREWESCLGNLFFSMILQPNLAGKELSAYSELAFVAAVGIAHALKDVNPNLNLGLKWPNDAMIDRKKVSGVLIEVTENGVVMGVGLNIISSPNNIDQPTTFLQQHCTQQLSRDEILQVILKSFWHFYVIWLEEGFIKVRQEWLKYAYQIGEVVERQGITGKFMGIDDVGAMILQDMSSGTKRKVA